MTDAMTAMLEEDPAEGTFSLDRKRPAALQVYEDLRRRIVEIRLKPGASFSRPAIADFYTVSQTPVRDAFLKLEQEGLVEVYPQSKTLVARIDVDHARETQFLRTAIEIEVVRTLVSRETGRTRLEGDRIVTDQIRAKEDGDVVQFSLLDRRFHALLCQAAEQPALWDLVQARSGHIDRLRNLDLPNPGKINRVIDEHTAIVQALTARDEAKAAAAVRKHLSGTLANIDHIVEAHPEYF